MKAAIYCRTSTEGQKDEQTILAQKTELPAYAKKQGWTIFDTYVDDGISGSKMSNRPDFLRLLEDMEDKKFDVLLVYSHSRITRTDNLAERGLILQTIKQSGVKVASPVDGTLDLDKLGDRLVHYFKSEMDSEEKKEITRRMKSGRKRHYENGSFPTNSVIYGLQHIAIRNEKDGKVLEHKVELHPEEHKVLREIYDWIVNEGYSLTRVEKELNLRGVKTKRGKKWKPAGLSALLKNEHSLTGTIYADRYLWEYDGEKCILKGEKPLEECTPIQVPAIFTKSEYSKIRAAIKKNRVDIIPGTNDRYLLRGKLRCANCGGNMVCRGGGNKNGRYRLYYCCKHRKSERFLLEGQNPCDLPRVPAEILDEEVWNTFFLKLLMKPEHSLRQWAQIGKGNKGEIRRLKKKLVETDRAIQKKDSKISRLLELFLGETSFTRQELESKKQEIEKEKKVLELDRQNVYNQLDGFLEQEKNVQDIKDASVDLQNIGEQIGKKLFDMTIQDKRLLMDVLIPHNAYVEIFELHPDDYHMSKSSVMKYPTERKWDWRFQGILNVQKLIEILKEYLETGKIPRNKYRDTKNDSCH